MILFDNKKYDGTLFFCQQAVEKGLKALAMKEKNNLKKIHDLVELGVDVSLPSELIEYCKEMAQSYIYSRYPDITSVKGVKKVSVDFLRYTEEILAWIKKKI